MFLTRLKARICIIKYIRDVPLCIPAVFRCDLRLPYFTLLSVSVFPAVCETRAPREPHGAKAGVVINDCGAASNSGVYPVCMKQNK